MRQMRRYNPTHTPLLISGIRQLSRGEDPSKVRTSECSTETLATSLVPLRECERGHLPSDNCRGNRAVSKSLKKLPTQKRKPSGTAMGGSPQRRDLYRLVVLNDLYRVSGGLTVLRGPQSLWTHSQGQCKIGSSPTHKRGRITLTPGQQTSSGTLLRGPPLRNPNGTLRSPQWKPKEFQWKPKGIPMEA